MAEDLLNNNKGVDIASNDSLSQRMLSKKTTLNKKVGIKKNIE